MGTRLERDARRAYPHRDARPSERWEPERQPHPHMRRKRRSWPARSLLAFCVVVASVAMAATVSMLLQPQSAPLARVRVAGQAAAAGVATATPAGATNATSGVVCHIPPALSGMLMPRQIEHPVQHGTRILGDGTVASCMRIGLPVPRPAAGNPNLPGQVILVSLTQQWLWAYQDGKMVFATPVTTGMPYLWTPQGMFPITVKRTDQMFYSPWPPGSPFYYTPQHVNYEMLFREKGFYIHDAPWRHAFGPGTEVPHTSPDGTQETGSHGCVEVVTPAAAWLYNWAAIGATVDIVA